MALDFGNVNFCLWADGGFTGGNEDLGDVKLDGILNEPIEEIDGDELVQLLCNENADVESKQPAEGESMPRSKKIRGKRTNKIVEQPGRKLQKETVIEENRGRKKRKHGKKQKDDAEINASNRPKQHDRPRNKPSNTGLRIHIPKEALLAHRKSKKTLSEKNAVVVEQAVGVVCQQEKPKKDDVDKEQALRDVEIQKEIDSTLMMVGCIFDKRYDSRLDDITSCTRDNTISTTYNTVEHVIEKQIGLVPVNSDNNAVNEDAEKQYDPTVSPTDVIPETLEMIGCVDDETENVVDFNHNDIARGNNTLHEPSKLGNIESNDEDEDEDDDHIQAGDRVCVE